MERPVEIITIDDDEDELPPPARTSPPSLPVKAPSIAKSISPGKASVIPEEDNTELTEVLPPPAKKRRRDDEEELDDWQPTAKSAKVKAPPKPKAPKKAKKTPVKKGKKVLAVEHTDEAEKENVVIDPVEERMVIDTPPVEIVSHDLGVC